MLPEHEPLDPFSSPTAMEAVLALAAAANTATPAIWPQR
jgi:hypothetical protein